MALKKVVQFKGKDAEYWTIIGKVWDKVMNQTNVVIGLYFSRATREQDIRNFIDKRGISFQGELTTEQCYVAIKAPKVDDEGKDCNSFADSEDV